MKNKKLFHFLITLILLVQFSNSNAVNCNCSFFIDEVVPCSSMCSSDGSISIISNQQFCTSLIQWGIILDGDTLENHFGGSSGCIHCPYTFSNLRPGTYTIFRLTLGNPQCLAEEIVTVTGLAVPCQSPYTITLQPPSVSGCYDGNVTLTNTSNCEWQSYFFDSDSILWAGPFPNTYSGGIISLQNIISNGIPAGTYYLHSIRTLPNGNLPNQYCDVWDTIIVNPSCFINANVTPAACANSHCNCSFKVTATTNGCAGYYSEITPLGGPTSNPEYAISGDTITFSNLFPQTYVVHTYPFAFGILPIRCEQFDTVVVPESPCLSPYSISFQQPTNYSCYNGNITLTNIADCYWLSYLYKDDTTNFIGGPWDNISYGTTFSLNTFFGGFNSGTYYIKSQVFNQTYFGQMTFCEVWDTIVLNGPCHISTSAFLSDCSNSNCNCSIKFVGNTGGCNHYEAELKNLGGTLLSYSMVFSGDTLTFLNLNPGTYIIHSYPEKNNLPIVCEKYDTIVIPNGPCLSPYSITVQDISCYNCYDGNITLINNSSCNWQTTVYKDDTSQAYTSTFPNTIFGGVIQMNYFRLDWVPGTYYIHSVANNFNSGGQSIGCDVWDTVVINYPPCTISAEVFTTGCLSEHCNCSIKVTSATGPIGSQFESKIFFLDGTYVWQNVVPSGDTLSFEGLYPGTYVIQTKPYVYGQEINCADYDTVIILDSPCLSPYTFEVHNASGYGCYDGNITFTNHSDCFWLSYVYKNDTSNLISGTIPNNLMGGVFSLDYLTGGLEAGTYYIHNIIHTIFLNDTNVYCDVWDTVIINGPLCHIETTVFSEGCASSNCYCKLKVTGQTGICSYYGAEVTTLDGDIVSQGSASNGDTITFDYLFPATYVVHSFASYYYLIAGCHDYDTIVIPHSNCSSPYSYNILPATGGCLNGNIILTNHSQCNWTTNVYKNDTNNLPLASFINFAFGGVISLDSYLGGLEPGIYYLHNSVVVLGNSGPYIHCDVWDSIVVGVSCQLYGSFTTIVQPTFPLCNTGSFTVTFSRFDCLGLSVNLINPSDSSIISTTLLTNTNEVTYTGLGEGNYIVEALNSSDPSCKWRAEMVLICQQQYLNLNLKVMIEGYYQGNGIMQAAVDPILYPNLCDTLTVELHRAIFPYPVIYSAIGTINITGEGSFAISGAAFGSFFYPVVKHRNALETWSSSPILFYDNVFYDFSNAKNKAYGDNLSDMNDGNFALFSGDISDAQTASVGIQDGVIESQDYGDMENAVYITLLGYKTEDITGDGVVESSDYGLMENNVYFTRVLIRP